MLQNFEDNESTNVGAFSQFYGIKTVGSFLVVLESFYCNLEMQKRNVVEKHFCATGHGNLGTSTNNLISTRKKYVRTIVITGSNRK